MFEQVLQPGNLKAAWKKVKANQGAPGIDGISVEEFASFMRQHWETIRRKQEEGSYRPSPVRRCLISKPDGSKRKLGIPTVLDRVIQQAITQVLRPVLEPAFSDHSCGYRPGRSAREAVEELQKEGNKRGSKCHVVDCDLKSFLDTVDHGKLMGRLRDEVDDFRLLRLIARYLKAGVILPDGTLEETTEGVPQGGPLSRSRS